MSYSDNDYHNQNKESVVRQWENNTSESLILILIRFNGKSTRKFDLMETYLIRNGDIELLKTQPALSWKARGKHWEHAPLE